MTSKGFVILTLQFRQDGKRWLARCEELGTSTYGRTLKQAQAELAELVTLHLTSLEATGQREHFFKTHNIRFYARASPPSVKRAVPVNDEWLTQIHRAPIGASA